jgi:hypothetical protein
MAVLSACLEEGSLERPRLVARRKPAVDGVPRPPEPEVPSASVPPRPALEVAVFVHDGVDLGRARKSAVEPFEREELVVYRLAIACVFLLAACTAAGPSSTQRLVSASPAAVSRSTSPAPAPAIAAPSSFTVASAIVGSWHRTIECSDVRSVFEQYGLLESHADWACKEGDPPHPHSHFFTEQGAFGSKDPGGAQVDDGDFKLLAPDTLEFPSHEEEFGFSPILVKFAVDGNATFSVQVPTECVDKCADAYAWALSAFGTNPWEPGELPD